MHIRTSTPITSNQNNDNDVDNDNDNKNNKQHITGFTENDDDEEDDGDVNISKGQMTLRPQDEHWTCFFTYASLFLVVSVYADRLVGLVVEPFASRAEDPEFESRLRRDFSGVESYQ